MNIVIVRTFVGLRKLSANYKEIMNLLNDMRKKYDAKFEELYSALGQLLNPPQKPRPRIGFRRQNEKD